ncbi:MAG TPA: hypothetical protein VER55_05255, partial [Ardenticatenaceae bacterium]|nr:hypothetical protein [Ardenticatenaceae bacterium]
MPDEMQAAPATREQAWNRAAYRRWQAFCDSRPAVAIMFLWALAEATVWPVIPDALLVLLAAGARRRYGSILLGAILGSAVGGMLTYLFAYVAPEQATALLPRLPLVQPFMIDRAHALLEQQGALAFLRQPWSGISFKIFA